MRQADFLAMSGLLVDTASVSGVALDGNPDGNGTMVAKAFTVAGTYHFLKTIREPGSRTWTGIHVDFR